MAEIQTFNIKKNDLLGALLYGHLVNIAIGAAAFVFCHWALGISVEQSVIITMITTFVVSIAIAVLGTRKLGEPIAAMHDELNELHKKINTAGNELTRTNQSTEALFDNLPTGMLVLDKEASLINRALAQIN